MKAGNGGAFGDFAGKGVSPGPAGELAAAAVRRHHAARCVAVLRVAVAVGRGELVAELVAEAARLGVGSDVPPRAGPRRV